MANYITMALDPNASNLYNLMSYQIGNYAQRIRELQLELENILTTRNLSVVDLMKKIAIRCKIYASMTLNKILDPTLKISFNVKFYSTPEFNPSHQSPA